jgi:hypothetical protein
VKQEESEETVGDAGEPTVACPAIVEEPHAEGDRHGEEKVLENRPSAADSTLSPEEERYEQREVVDQVGEISVDHVPGDRTPGLERGRVGRIETGAVLEGVRDSVGLMTENRYDRDADESPG